MHRREAPKTRMPHRYKPCGMNAEQSYYLMHYGDTLNNASMPDIMRKHAHSRTIGYFLAGRSIGSIGMMCSRL